MMAEEKFHSISSMGLQLCHRCERLCRAEETRCSTCGDHLAERPRFRIQQTLALLALASILYVPANTLPIIESSQFGEKYTNTILSGVAALWRDGSYLVAGIIFVASVFVPLGKIAGLAWLCLATTRWKERQALQRSRMFRLVQASGRWSMLDVFVVAVLAGLVQLGPLLSVAAGPAALPFAGVVIATMVAARRFDEREIWLGTETAAPETE